MKHALNVKNAVKRHQMANTIYEPANRNQIELK